MRLCRGLKVEKSLLTLVIYSDYINPIDLCNRLNTYIIPEAAVHGFLTFLFLINGYWLALILNLPLLGFNVKKYVFPLHTLLFCAADHYVASFCIVTFQMEIFPL
jgi:hypothetical protein